MPSQSDLIYIGICYKRKISIAHHCTSLFNDRKAQFNFVFEMKKIVFTLFCYLLVASTQARTHSLAERLVIFPVYIVT